MDGIDRSNGVLAMHAERGRESPLERYAWTVFLLLSIVLALFGIGDLITGAATFGQGEAATARGITGTTWAELSTGPAAPLVDWNVRAQAIWMFFVGALSALVAVTAFRRGERWAWFAMGLWPLALAAIDLNLLSAYRHAGSGIPPPLVSGAVFIILSIAALAVSFRRAFRRSDSAGMETAG